MICFRIGSEPPRVSAEPAGPNRLMLMSGVLGASLGTGVALAFLIAQLWPTFDSRHSLMQATNIPVFGSVGIILSAHMIRRQRLKMLMFFSLFSLLLLLYAGLMIGQITHLIQI